MRKRILLVPDGMADEPQAALGGRTPLEAADTPCMDGLARGGVVGLVRTIPEGMAAASDVANLAVLGYDPAAVFSGRSPLEAASIGVDLGPDDVSYRCNLVTVVDGVMKDHTAGSIGNDAARRCVAALQAATQRRASSLPMLPAVWSFITPSTTVTRLQRYETSSGPRSTPMLAASSGLRPLKTAAGS